MDLLGDIDTAIEEAIPTEEKPPVDDEESTTDDGKGEDSEETEETEEEEESEESTDGDEDGDESDGEEKPDETEKKGDKKPKSRYQKRTEELQKSIDELTRERYALRAENNSLKEQHDSKPPELPPKPDPEKYTYTTGNQEEEAEAVARYNQDLGKWNAECELIKKNHANRHNIRIQEEMGQYFRKMESEKSEYGDYNKAYRNISDNKFMNAEFHNALKDSPNSTDLFCFLGNRPDIARSVFELKGFALSRKLAEISVKLELAKSRQKTKSSKAPKPPAKVKGHGGKAKVLSDNSSFEEISDALVKAQNKLSKKWI
jgi:hypothetical protein